MGGGRNLVKSGGEVRMFFCGLKFMIFGIFWVETFGWDFVFGRFILPAIFLCIHKNGKICGKNCYGKIGER